MIGFLVSASVAISLITLVIVVLHYARKMGVTDVEIEGRALKLFSIRIRLDGNDKQDSDEEPSGELPKSSARPAARRSTRRELPTGHPVTDPRPKRSDRKGPKRDLGDEP